MVCRTTDSSVVHGTLCREGTGKEDRDDDDDEDKDDDDEDKDEDDEDGRSSFHRDPASLLPSFRLK